MSFWKSLIVGFVAVFFVGTQVWAKPQFSALTVDARNGQVLYADQIDGLRRPASLTKMMTLYLVFQDLKSGRISLATRLQVSRRAAGMAPSKLFLKPGETISVEDAIKALVTKSANDVAATIAENLGGGSEQRFAARMTQVAQVIGMKRTRFANASGLPNPAQITTARDMATLGLRLMRDFPQYYPYFRIQAFTFKGRTIRTHNTLVQYYEGTDGIKTGYIAESGFNLVTSTRKGNRRLVGVVLGARSSAARGRYMRNMLEHNFPNAQDGNTIAALAGSSKGVINPVAITDQVQTATIGKVDQAALIAKAKDVKIASVNDAPATLPNALANSWTIEVGSFGKKVAAEDKLATLRGLMGRALAGKQAFTMQDDANGKVSYSARFGGFNAAAAKKTCAQVLKLGSACLLVEPQA